MNWLLDKLRGLAYWMNGSWGYAVQLEGVTNNRDDDARYVGSAESHQQFMDWNYIMPQHIWVWTETTKVDFKLVKKGTMYVNVLQERIYVPRMHIAFRHLEDAITFKLAFI